MSGVLDVSASPNTVRRPEAIGGVQKVADVTDHPGEDDTFDRTWGGGLAKYESCAQATGDQQIGSAGPIIYYGYSIAVATSAHNVLLRDGTSDSGTIVDAIPVSAAIGSKYVYPAGIYCASGIWIDWNSASTGTIVVYYHQL